MRASLLDYFAFADVMGRTVVYGFQPFQPACRLLVDTAGPQVLDDPAALSGFNAFADDSSVQERFAAVRRERKVALGRIINVPARGIGDVTMERLGVHARGEGVTLWTVMRKADEYDDLYVDALAYRGLAMVEAGRVTDGMRRSTAGTNHQILHETGGPVAGGAPRPLRRRRTAGRPRRPAPARCSPCR